VHRLCGGLDPAHDLQPTADQAGKDPAATRRRLARMLGLDAHEATDQAWHALAEAWRERQLQDLAAALQGVLTRHRLGERSARGGQPLHMLAAGCGAFLLPPLLDRVAAAQAVPRETFIEQPYAAALTDTEAGGPADAAAAAAWIDTVQVAAPAAAVAALLAREVG
jgi:uncharacterized hydantoinase/oxoprolinase family protein